MDANKHESYSFKGTYCLDGSNLFEPDQSMCPWQAVRSGDTHIDQPGKLPVAKVYVPFVSYIRVHSRLNLLLLLQPQKLQLPMKVIIRHRIIGAVLGIEQLPGLNMADLLLQLQRQTHRQPRLPGQRNNRLG